MQRYADLGLAISITELDTKLEDTSPASFQRPPPLRSEGLQSARRSEPLSVINT